MWWMKRWRRWLRFLGNRWSELEDAGGIEVAGGSRSERRNRIEGDSFESLNLALEIVSLANSWQGKEKATRWAAFSFLSGGERGIDSVLRTFTLRAAAPSHRLRRRSNPLRFLSPMLSPE